MQLQISVLFLRFGRFSRVNFVRRDAGLNKHTARWGGHGIFFSLTDPGWSETQKEIVSLRIREFIIIHRYQVVSTLIGLDAVTGKRLKILVRRRTDM